MEKKTKKAKLEFFKFWENRLNRKAIAFEKISRNCAFYGNWINIHLVGHFCMQNSFLQWKKCKILWFSWKRKNNRKSFIFVNCLRFSPETLEQIVTKSNKILILDGKEDKECKIRNFEIFQKIRWIARL